MVLLVFQLYPVSNFGPFINNNLDLALIERVNVIFKYTVNRMVD